MNTFNNEGFEKEYLNNWKVGAMSAYNKGMACVYLTRHSGILGRISGWNETLITIRDAELMNFFLNELYEDSILVSPTYTRKVEDTLFDFLKELSWV